ncbi:hypothetical protein CDO44_14075 [Pigmentiphaga sp. NML080357]|uniref:hypothetical protein n=1 Tax=Pigmentiphaga sp. NML080357 TaxID=2008675 RepID=UPI000B4120FD|nr:hypothetical protein [Pigmentiphaga sp. NML080357]OVZ58823.1 hypothetical protein CDO44_14075 [Pigmentiphaga sp. NML080357]
MKAIEGAIVTDPEFLKGQITALQNVVSMLISAHPNAQQLRQVMQAIAQQVEPTLNEAHPSFKKGWQNVIATLCQTDDEAAPDKNEQH